MSESWTATSEVAVAVLKRAVHPGEILSEELQEWGCGYSIGRMVRRDGAGGVGSQ